MGGGYDFDPRCQISLLLRGEWYSREHGDDTFTTIEEVCSPQSSAGELIDQWGKFHSETKVLVEAAAVFRLTTAISSAGVDQVQLVRPEHTAKSRYRHEVHEHVNLQQRQLYVRPSANRYPGVSVLRRMFASQAHAAQQILAAVEYYYYY